MRRFLILTFSLPAFLFFTMSSMAKPYSISLSDAQTDILANLIWQNEGAKKIKNLTVWNKNEAFPSLGIGHFIWYPTKEKGPYIEQFPELLTYIKAQNITIPPWLINIKTAPWQSREAFYDAFEHSQLRELRVFLEKTIQLQALFIIKRLETGIPAILASSTKVERDKLEKEIFTLTSTPEGIFVLLDYINFKGEGISIKERYQGKGWGLKQVLLAMPDHSNNILASFALSADEVLTRRVKNAPKNEINWLKGWRVRIHKYPTLKIK